MRERKGRSHDIANQTMERFIKLKYVVHEYIRFCKEETNQNFCSLERHEELYHLLTRFVMSDKNFKICKVCRIIFNNSFKKSYHTKENTVPLSHRFFYDPTLKNENMLLKVTNFFADFDGYEEKENCVY